MFGSIEERVGERLRDLPTETTPEGVLRELLDELLGEHADTRRMLLVGAAFSLRTQTDPNVAAVLTAGDADILELAVAAVRQAQAARRTSRSLKPQIEARILLTLATSLGVEVAVGQRTIGDARTILSYALDRTFGQVR